MNASILSCRRLGFFAAVWAVLGGGALVVSACYGRNCEGAQLTYGVDAGQGEMIDEEHWQSSAPSSNWLPFPRQHSYSFTLPLGGRTPFLVIPEVSAQPNGNIGNSTLGSGNLTQKANVGPNHVDVTNDTCSDYYLRVVAFVGAFPPSVDAGGGSAISGEDAGPPDASSDAVLIP